MGFNRILNSRFYMLLLQTILATTLVQSMAFAQQYNFTLKTSDNYVTKTVNAGTPITLVATIEGSCFVQGTYPNCQRECSFPSSNNSNHILINESSPQSISLFSSLLFSTLTDGSCSVTPGITQNASYTGTFSPATYAFVANVDGHTPISNNVNIVVQKVATTTSISVAGTPTAGSVQLNASVTASASGAPKPSGSVQFNTTLNGQAYSTSAPLNSQGLAAATFSLPASTASVTVTATYPGDSNLNSSQAQVAINSIAKAASTTSPVTSSPQCLPLGGTATLSASVSGFAPGGRVDFLDGSTIVGSATATNSSNSLGTTLFQGSANLSTGFHSLTASYAGDSNNIASVSPPISNLVPGILTKASWDYTSNNIGGTNGFAHYFADLNGDRRSDWIQVAKGSNNAYISLTDSSGLPGIFKRGVWDYSSTNIGQLNNFTHFFADVNGDGKADWIQVSNSTNIGYVSLADASGVPGIFTKGTWDYSSSNIGAASGYTHYFADVNGDGKADWIQVSNSTNIGYVSLADASGVPGIFTKGTWDYSSSNIGAASGYTHYFADLNGDGKADWIQVSNGSNIGYVSLADASGVPGILSRGAWDYSSGNIGATNNYSQYFADLNGDGKADWIQVAKQSNNANVSLTDAAGVPGVFTKGTWDFTSSNIGASSNFSHYFADFNFDGKKEWVQIANGTNNGYLSFAPGTASSCP